MVVNSGLMKYNLCVLICINTSKLYLFNNYYFDILWRKKDYIFIKPQSAKTILSSVPSSYSRFPLWCWVGQSFCLCFLSSEILDNFLICLCWKVKFITFFKLSTQYSYQWQSFKTLYLISSKGQNHMKIEFLQIDEKPSEFCAQFWIKGLQWGLHQHDFNKEHHLQTFWGL